MIQLKLPQKLQTKLEYQLGDEFPEFLATYEKPRVAGLRANGLKVTPDSLKKLLPYLGETVQWCNDGFYYDDSAVRPAKHPYYAAGLYYIQEPSAMLPATLLSAQSGERVLDLCAAPGGKSVQLADQIGLNGLLVTNDIHPQRAKALLKNIERYGVVQAVVTNEPPDRLSKIFSGFFDKILVDAPCSGEGMFRKEPSMAKDWSMEEVAKYARWQQEILSYIPDLLRPGGKVVYSTCTFSLEENEEQIEHFVRHFPQFIATDLRRLWPHRHCGEGHFAAKLIQTGDKIDLIESPCSSEVKLSTLIQQAIGEFSLKLWGSNEAWIEWLPPNGAVVERTGHVLWESGALPSLKGLKVLRSGWLLGIWEKGRFRPSQAYVMGLPALAVTTALQRCDFNAAEDKGRYDAIRYLRGETIQTDHDWQSGWHIVTVDGFPLGWGKGSGQGLKNEYPPGWRWED